MSEIFLIPPELLQNSSDPPPPPHNKVAELVSVFEAEIDHPLGLLKVKAGNLRGTLIVVQIKLQNSHHINIFTRLIRNLADNFPSYFHISFAIGNRLPWQQSDISISQCRRPRFGIEVQLT